MTESDSFKHSERQLKEYTEAYATQFKSSRSNEMDRKYAWKLIPPKDNEPTVKNVLIDGKTKFHTLNPAKIDPEMGIEARSFDTTIENIHVRLLFQLCYQLYYLPWH